MRLDRADTDARAAGPVITAAAGSVRGRIEAGVRVFLGIPYARPPVGSLRFVPPCPATPWTGIRDATNFAPAAPQAPDQGLYPGDPDAMPHVETSEDCLYLNIWAPLAPGPHPVLVWLHGGGQVLGGPQRPVYDGSCFARQGIVCVTVGHRLGAFGYLTVPGYSDGLVPGSANLAMADQIAALRWVHDNIAAFGGAPHRVTLGGESAGGKNVAALMASPAATDLFDAAIVQSGGGDTVHTLAEAHSVTNRLLGLAGEDWPTLMALPVSDVMSAQEALLRAGGRRFPFRPAWGHHLLPRAPVSAIAAGMTRRRALLVGTSRDEVAPFIPATRLQEGWSEDMLSHHRADDMDRIEARLPPELRRLSTVERRRALLAAENYALPATRLADANALSGAPTWMYRFDLPLPSGPLEGWVPHTADLAPTWARPSRYDTLPGRPADMLNSLVATFARMHRAPWAQYDSPDRMTALIDDSTRVVSWPGTWMFRAFDP